MNPFNEKDFDFRIRLVILRFKQLSNPLCLTTKCSMCLSYTKCTKLTKCYFKWLKYEGPIEWNL